MLAQYCSSDKIEMDEMGWACGAYGGEDMGVYRILVGRDRRERDHWGDLGVDGSITLSIQVVGCGSMNWIELARDRDRWRHL